MKNNHLKISRAHWYRLGGFANSALFRRANKRGAWSYYVNMDHPDASGLLAQAASPANIKNRL